MEIPLSLAFQLEKPSTARETISAATGAIQKLNPGRLFIVIANGTEGDFRDPNTESRLKTASEKLSYPSEKLYSLSILNIKSFLQFHKNGLTPEDFFLSIMKGFPHCSKLALLPGYESSTRDLLTKQAQTLRIKSFEIPPQCLTEPDKRRANFWRGY